MHFRDYEIRQTGQYIWEIPQTGNMQCPARIYSTSAMMEQLIEEKEPLQQVINVAHLPGIEKYSLAMPDIHWGYGFPIGGVAATDWHDGVISPGGVGYDINCGVRLAATNIRQNDISNRLSKLTEELFRNIPTGLGSSNAIRKLNQKEMKKVLEQGVSWVIGQGFGSADDLEYIEENGQMAGADSRAISSRAIERGQVQMGTLGSGNHFLEIDYVETIYDQEAADVFGLFPGQIVLLLHTGSRGLGYQVCDDHLKIISKALPKFKFRLPDRQLAAAPIQSPEGQHYLAAMACSANYAWSNRQVIMHLARNVFNRVLHMSDAELGFRLVYDVSHNIAKKETHTVGDEKKELCVHRKGATRAFGKNHSAIPKSYRPVGQPVLIPGDMGRYSYVCCGTEKAEEETFGSTCHGAGRLHSRNQAKRMAEGRDLLKEMSRRGVTVQARGRSTMAEEMPEAYKDVAEVVQVMDASGISSKVARLKPLGVIKG